jgi:hypothetical protein
MVPSLPLTPKLCRSVKAPPVEIENNVPRHKCRRDRDLLRETTASDLLLAAMAFKPCHPAGPVRRRRYAAGQLDRTWFLNALVQASA